ncbi:MAG: M3 family metallopeptidase [Flavisolibacter sp.]|jgi:peptidyl-dipeptidase Dcp|nr:M3 family metallopeptidase [Flavisolibacter sp.]
MSTTYLKTLFIIKFLSVTFALMAQTNPLLEPWTGPYNGVPPFDKVRVEHFKPALEAAMASYLHEINAISTNPSKPDFKNTLGALERAGSVYKKIITISGIWGSNMSSPEFQLVEKEMAPKMAALNDKIFQNAKLFHKIEAIYNQREKSGLTAEQKRLAWVYHNNFVRAGAKLNATAKAKLSRINQELAGLFTSFSQNVLYDENNQYMTMSEDQTGGLPQSFKDAAANAAADRGLYGSYIVTNTRSSVDPFLTYSTDRSLREKAWKMFVNRGDGGGERDNNALITKILQLRMERANLLGYKTHAHWRLENTMAKTPENAMALLETVWKPAVSRVKEEVKDMQAMADAEGAGIKIEPWDYRFYAEKVRKQRYDLDFNEVKQYMQLDKLRDGMFWVAGELFGFDFSPVDSVPVYHPDVKVWEVTSRITGEHVGLWYFDPYARTGKRSGAWMNAYRRQEKLDGSVTTIVSNNSNFVRGNHREPVLISWDDAETLFHEFGHALHGLSSNVTYPLLSGTAVARDYVEFPSQLLEHWLSTPEVLQKFALHYQTGKPIPAELVKKIENASTFNQGFATTEYLASALIDMKLHLAGNKKIDPDQFEKETLESLGMPKEIVMRHRTPHFTHVFASDGYSAGYYSYLWSDVITADAYGAFTDAGGPYDSTIAKRLNDYIFSVGNTIDPAEGYKKFRGRNPETNALMIKRGFDPVVADPNKERMKVKDMPLEKRMKNKL